MPNRVDFNLYLISDRHQVAHGQALLTVVEQALLGGVRAVQLREKDLSINELLPMAKDLRQLTTAYRAKLFINHHVELAMQIEADGVHLGGQSLPTPEARQILGPELLIGVSTHSKAEVLQAAADGADFVTFGPVYATPSKASYGPPQGLDALSEVCRESALPVFALGGIKADNVPEVTSVGAAGIALISAIIASPNPKSAAEAFLRPR